MWDPIWASRFRYWLLTGDESRSCLHSSRTHRVRALNVQWQLVLWFYVFWCTEGSSEFRMWSRTWRGVSKWSRHEDWYIGSLCLDIGSVSGEIGILPEYREVTGTPRGLNGPTWALVEIEGSKGSVGHAPQGPNRIGLGQRGPAPSFLLPLSLSFPLSYSY